MAPDSPPLAMPGNDHSTLRIRPAAASDIDDLHRLRRSLEDWLVAQGIDQWRPGEIKRDRIAAEVDRGEWHAVHDCTSHLIAALRLLDADPEFWPDDHTTARYVHGLMVARHHTGRSIGRALLDWSTSVATAQGVDRIRLDCAESNSELREYYIRAGFQHVGRRVLGSKWQPVALFEKVIS